tara:strand:- start:372 stop:1124 length:753 start_codon:yes stop_codon:yes gene_type:complete
MDISLELIDVDKLIEYPDNPRVGNVEEIKKSLVENAQYKPLIVNKKTMHVLVGNHTLQAMKELNYEKVNVNLIEVDELQEKKIVLADNKLSDNSEYDNEKLTAILDDLMNDGELIGTGFDVDDVDDLLASLEAPIITEFEEFQGGFALDDDEIKKLKEDYIATETSNKEARGGERLRDVMLHYPESQYEKFVDYVETLSNSLGVKKAQAIYYAVEILYNENKEVVDDFDTEFEEVKPKDNAITRIFKRNT